MNLTKDFELKEFCTSETAARMGRPIIPTDAITAQLARLCKTALQPIRDSLGKPLIITSGYRPPWLNALIGGSKTSAHMLGRAADFHCYGMRNYDLAQFIESLVEKLMIDQLIYEYGQWVHVGIAEPGLEPRREVLTATRRDGKTVYARGLILQKEDV